MKKKSLLMVLALTFMSAMMFVSCGSKEEEQVKWIPAPHFSGQHADLLRCTADSVKVILTKASDSDKSWEVRAMVPMANTMPWSNVPGTDENQSEYFKAEMGNLGADFLDANGSPIDYELKPDWNKVAAMLASDVEVFEDVWFTIRWEMHRSDYKKMKAIFDKVQGMEIKKMDLTTVYHVVDSSSESSSSSSSNEIDQLLDKYEQLIDKYNSMKKSNNYDYDALDDLDDDIEDLTDKLEAAADKKMSSAQLKRYNKIFNKFY